VATDAKFSMSIEQLPAQEWDTENGIVARYEIRLPADDPHDPERGRHRVASFKNSDVHCDCPQQRETSCDGRKVVRALRRGKLLPDEV